MGPVDTSGHCSGHFTGRTYHDAGLTGSSNDGGEDRARSIVSGKTGCRFAKKQGRGEWV